MGFRYSSESRPDLMAASAEVCQALVDEAISELTEFAETILECPPRTFIDDVAEFVEWSRDNADE